MACNRTTNSNGKSATYSASVVILLSLAGPASAAPETCSVGIDRVQADLDAALAKRAAAGKTAKQSDFATMRRQPTPETIARAEAVLGDWEQGSLAVSALSEARMAKARNDQPACLEALKRARDIIRE